jgi:hypothetical protein
MAESTLEQYANRAFRGPALSAIMGGPERRRRIAEEKAEEQRTQQRHFLDMELGRADLETKRKALEAEAATYGPLEEGPRGSRIQEGPGGQYKQVVAPASAGSSKNDYLKMQDAFMRGEIPKEDWERYKKKTFHTRAGDRIIIEGQKYQTESERLAAKANMEEWEEYREAGKLADRQLDNVAIAEKFMSRMSDMSLGFWSKPTLAMKKFAKASGFDLEYWGTRDDVAAAEAFRAHTMKFTLELIDQTKGAISERENDMFLAASPGLMNTREGNQLILDTYKALAKRQKTVTSMFRKFQRETNYTLVTKDGESWEDRLKKWQDANPLIDSPEWTQKYKDAVELGEPLPMASGSAGTPRAALPKGVTDEDIRFTAKQRGMTEDQVRQLIMLNQQESQANAP